MQLEMNMLIENLKISTRTINALKSSDIDTLKELLEHTEEYYENMSGLGKKSLEEIKDLIKEANDQGLGSGQYERYFQGTKILVYSDNKSYEDLAIKEAGFSNRTTNALRGEGYEWISDILNLNEEELLNIKNLGKGSIDELLKFRVVGTLKEAKLRNDKVAVLCYELYEQLCQGIRLSPKFFYENTIGICNDYITKKYPDGEYYIEEELYIKVLETPYMLEIVEQQIVNICERYEYGCSIENVVLSLPENLQKRKIVIDSIYSMASQGVLVKNGAGLMQVKKESFRIGLKSYLRDKEYDIILKRIEGETLEDIGEYFNLSRERIRQLELKAMEKIRTCPLLFSEDIYRSIFIKYLFTEEEFGIAFQDTLAYKYLGKRYLEDCKLDNRKSLEDALSDTDIPEFYRKGIQKAVYKDYVKIGEEYVLLNKHTIMEYVLKNYAQDIINRDEFTECYLRIIESLGKADDKKVSEIDRGVVERLADSKKALRRRNHQFRYYNFDEYNFDLLLEELNLNQYTDIEYSAYKFYLGYPDLMIEYDIRNEYELHNLLKKLYEGTKSNINFSRMPNIIFGDADRIMQIAEVLVRLAPVTLNELADQYEEEYGVVATTVKANYLKPFEQYYHDGYYRIDVPLLPQPIADDMKQILTDDFYLLEEIYEQLKANYPELSHELHNPLVVKMLGFKVYSNYVISEQYGGATEYFRSIFEGKDYIDLKSIDEKIKKQLQFYVVLYKLKSDYDIVEKFPRKYISYTKMQQIGITKEMIYDFVKCVDQYVKSGEIFTYCIIKREGFAHELDNLGFDNWFYVALLSEKKEIFKYKRIGGNKLLGKHVMPTLGGLVEKLICQLEERHMNVYDVLEIVKQDYRINTTLPKIIEGMQYTNLFYDKISENIYVNYELYYENIK